MDTRVFWSVGEMAEQTSEPLHRVTSAISSRSIEPTLVVGGRRLYDAVAMARIRQILKGIDQRKGARHEAL